MAKSVNGQQKSGPLRGVGAWKNLESAGDCKRFFRWCILALKDGKLDRQTASILGQLGTYLLRTIEGHELERRIETLEQAAATVTVQEQGKGTVWGPTNGGPRG
ncbi:MAG: hypothetical protein ACRERD_08730 [Candidatus Binatia bacterium]